MRKSILIATTVLLALGMAVPASADPGPALETPVAELDAALHCDSGIDTATKNPVLFIPGTTVKGSENFGWNYAAVLRKQGIAVCLLDYPARGYQDMQVTSEYVVHAIRTMNARSGHKVSTIGHSQGGLHPAWVLRFWPDLASKMDDVISFGSPYQGTASADRGCKLGNAVHVGCFPAAHQFRTTSEWVKALNRAPLPAGPAYTSLYTFTDEAASPGKPASDLPGAPGLAHIGTQQICPGRVGEHLALAVDSVIYALVMDALGHDGPADASRISKKTCLTAFMPIDVPELAQQLPSLLSSPLAAIWQTPPNTWVTTEPPLRPYAQQG
ncbi:hypothetical protein D5S17_07585 [Pseudonocardiaceae bacterium YIM PH 21723]|nr:hypothetical protein D5S17_07585 [Pseudonocardiaceae bacterium YIM PH 21723]